MRNAAHNENETASRGVRRHMNTNIHTYTHTHTRPQAKQSCITACFCIRSPGVHENAPDPAYTARLGIEQGCATLATPNAPTKLYNTFGG